MVSARLVMLMLAVDAQVAAAYDSSGLKDGERSGELVFRSRELPCIGLMLFDDAGEAALLASVKMNRLMHSESENFLKVVSS